MKYLTLSIFISVLFLLVSCDPITTVDYVIENNSSEPINITLKNWSAEQEEIKTILPGESTLIYSDQSIGYTEDYVRKNTEVPLTSIVVYQLNQPLEFNIKQLSYWTYTFIDKQAASYHISLDDEDFE